MAEQGNSSDELLVHITYIREAVDQVNRQVFAQNGRIGKAETDIAILKDRQSDARKMGGAWGTGGGFLGGLVAGFIGHWMGK